MLKKKCKYNWPELDTYCGCCSLSTGIYIRSAINLVIFVFIILPCLLSSSIIHVLNRVPWNTSGWDSTNDMLNGTPFWDITTILITLVLLNVVTALTIICNSNLLSRIMGINPIVFSTNLTNNENYTDSRGSNIQQDLATLHIIYNSIVVYYILYLCYKAIYVLILLWTLFAIFKRSGKMIKILLCVSVPNLILDILISSLAALILRISMRVVLLICILSEVYNILALSSEYKKIMGKSRVRYRDIESERGTPSMPSFINPPYGNSRCGYNQVHCRGCNCTINGPPDNGNEVISTQPSENSMQTLRIADKEIDENKLNYALTGILNPRNTEESVRNETAGSASGHHAVRPNTLDLTANMVKDEKVMITDEPVIYDVNQFNVGTSPVIEDREREV